MNQQTLELLRALQSSERDSTAFAHIRVLLPQERTRLAATDDRATLADISELLEVWADSSEPALAGVAALEAARIAEDDLEQAERAAQLYLLSVERSPLEGEALRRLDGLLVRRGQHERLEAMLAAHLETLARTPNASAEILAARYRRLGQLRAERGAALDNAIEAYERSVDLAADVDAIRELADLYARRGAQNDATQAADLYCMLAELTTPEQGVPLLEQALDHVPGHEAALDLLETYVPAGEQDARLERRWAAYIASSNDEPAIDRRRILLARAYASQNRERDALICLGPLIEKSDADALRMQATLLSGLQEHEQRDSASGDKTKSGNGKAVRPPTLVGFRMPEPAQHARSGTKAEPTPAGRVAQPDPKRERAVPEKREDETPIPSGSEAVSVKRIQQSEGERVKVKPPRSGETLVGFRLPTDGVSADGSAPKAVPGAESSPQTKAEKAVAKSASAPPQKLPIKDKTAREAKQPNKTAEPDRKSATPATAAPTANAKTTGGSAARALAPSAGALAASKAAVLKASRASAPPVSRAPASSAPVASQSAAAKTAASLAKSAELRASSPAAVRISSAPPAARAPAARAIAAALPVVPSRAPALATPPLLSAVPATVAAEATSPPAASVFGAEDELSATRRRPSPKDKRVWLVGGAALVACATGLWLAMRPSASVELKPAPTRGEAVAAVPVAVPAAPPPAAVAEPAAAPTPAPAPTPAAPVVVAPQAELSKAHEQAPAHEIAKSKKGAPSPRLTPGKPHVTGGSLSAQQVSLVLEDALPAIEHCYADALESSPKLKGKIVFGWSIEKSGRPGKVHVLSGTLKDDGVQQCSSDALHKVKFPKSKKKASEITWPLEYSTKKS